MPSFSSRSEAQLATCDERLVHIARHAIKIIDFIVLEGHRDQEGQMRAIMKGTTQLPWPKSKHNRMPSIAMDIAPWPISWLDTERFVFLQGVVFACASQLGIPVRFGIDWDMDREMKDEKFRDFPHVELVDP